MKRSCDSSDSEENRYRSRHRSKRREPKFDSRMDSTVGSTLLVNCALLTVFQATDRRSRMRAALTKLARSKNMDKTVSLNLSSSARGLKTNSDLTLSCSCTTGVRKLVAE